MQLVLEVISRHADKMGTNRLKVFHQNGGRIGRDPDNDWSIADDFVSGHHATVRFVNNMFFIEHHGRNCTSVNDRSRVLARNGQEVLRDGDTLFIDDYEISVRVVDDDYVVEMPLDPRPVDTPTRSTPREDMKPRGAAELLKRLPKVTKGDSRSTRPKAAAHETPGHRVLQQALRPQQTCRPVDKESAGISLEDDWFKTRYPRAAEPTQSSVNEGAGASPAQQRLSPASVESKAVKAILDAQFATATSVGVRDVRAMFPAVDDVTYARYHELAMGVAIKAGFQSVLAQFDPGRLQSWDALFSAGSSEAQEKADLWDAYVAMHKSISVDPSRAFETYFGVAFREAYIGEMKRCCV